MKTRNLIALVLILFASCSKDKDAKPGELDGLKLVSTIENTGRKLFIYTASGELKTGYNEVYFQIADRDGTLVENATNIAADLWLQASLIEYYGPSSPIAKENQNKVTYSGTFVFQQPGSGKDYDSENWFLTYTYFVGNVPFVFKDYIKVSAASKHVVESFKAKDNQQYIVALVDPKSPVAGINDMTAVLYRYNSEISYTDLRRYKPVDNFKIKIDPRSTAASTNSSTGNIDLSQRSGATYAGRINVPAPGYWRINLQIENAAGTVIKGEPVNGITVSSIFFELNL